MVLHKNESGKARFFNLGGNMVTVEPGGYVDLPHYLDGSNGVKPCQDKEAAPAKKLELKEPECTLESLMKLSKDALNDFAARLGLTKEVKQSMDKKAIVARILNHGAKK